MNQINSRTTLGFALATVCIDSIGIGLIFPVMPELLKTLGEFSIGQAALWGGALSMLYALLQFLCAPLLGALSDRYGRRPVLLIGLAALTLDYLILSVAGGLAVLLIGRAVAGAAGATYATASAVIADITPAAQRAARFGLVGATFGVGFVLGPVLGGLVAEWHVRAPFMLAAALAGLNLLFGAITFPETLAVSKRRPFDWRAANPFRALYAAMSMPGLTALLTAFGLFHLANHVYPTLWAFWGNAAFGWSPATIGITLATYGSLMAIVQGALVGPIVNRFGEERVALWGCVMGACAAGGFSVVHISWMVFPLIAVAALSDLAPPALTSLMSRQVSESEQGALQGVLSAITALTAVLTPPIVTGLFYFATSPARSTAQPGAPYLVTAALLGVTVWVLHRHSRPPA